MSSQAVRQPLFIRFLDSFFRLNAHFIVERPIFVIVVMLVFTFVCSIKVPFTKQKDDFKVGYTPVNARALKEMEIYNTFSKGELVMIGIFVVAADGGSMARISHLNETVKLIDEVGTKFKVRNISFNDFCTNFCFANEPVATFRNGLILQEELIRNGQPPDLDHMNLSFRVMSFLGREFDLSPNFYGVETYDSCKLPSNAYTNIKHLSMVCLLFRANRPQSWSDEDVIEWDRRIGNYYRDEYKNPLIIPTMISFLYAQDEIVRTTNTLFPYITVGFSTMVVFSIITVYLGARYFGQWSIHKISFAVNACVCPLLASSASLGLLFWCGFRFGSILLVTPFLVLAIGVNDAYIIINAWERICIERKLNPVPNDTLRDRITEVLVSVGPSVTITSLTNMLAFAVSAFSPTPEIRLFCTANILAMFFDFLYTITLYMAIVTVGAEHEMKSEKQNSTKMINKSEQHHLLSNFVASYCDWLSSGFTSLTIFLFMCAYWSISIYGILQVKPELTPTKLFIADSPINEAQRLQNKYVRPEYTYITIIVNQVGDLKNSSRVERIKSLVADFEAMPECIGPKSSRFWMREYEAFLGNNEVEFDGNEVPDGDENGTVQPYSAESIKQFLEWPEEKIWGGFMNINNMTNEVESFFVLIAYHGSNFSNWNEKLRLLTHWRAIVDNYTDLSASVFEDDASFTDQIETLVPLTAQSSLCTLICMVVVCLFFMHNAFTVLVAAASIVSIFVGVVGCLTLWGVSLDPISMSTIILSIGISVDFPAHITYHYHHTGLMYSGRSPAQRVAKALTVIGYPLVQCSLANMLYVLCFLFVDCYMGEIFIKTIILVVSFGVLHALLAIPALLCAFSKKGFSRIVPLS